MNRPPGLAVLLIIVVTAVIQIAVASRSGLWADEVFSLAIATGHSLEHPAAVANPQLGDFVQTEDPVSREELTRYLQHDNPPASPGRVLRAVLLSDTSPPLYYFLLYLWTFCFGTSDIALRLFSIACALACLPLLAAIARRTGGKPACIPACLLFAFSPLAVYYSTEGRMYSLLWLSVLATIWLSILLHEGPASLVRCCLWIVASAAGFLTHYFFVFPWVAIVAVLLIMRGGVPRGRLIWSILALGSLLLPWYIRMPQSLGSWRITYDWLNWRPGHFSRPREAVQLVLQFFSGSNQSLWSTPRYLVFVAVLLFLLVAIALAWRLRLRLLRWNLAMLWLPFTAACLGPLVFDLWRHTYTVAVPRYAIAALPCAYLLAAIGLANLQSRWRLAILALILAVWVPSIWGIYQRSSRSGSPMRELARAASKDNGAGDLILVHSIPSGVLGVARYATGPALFAAWVGQLKTRNLPESLTRLIAGRARVLLIRVHEVGEPAPEEDWLAANAALVGQKRLQTTKLEEFRPISGQTF